jgi:signal transduction histidine kinase
MSDIRAIVKNIDFFKCLSQSDLDDIIVQLRTVHYPAGEIIFEESSPGDYFFFVVSGSVTIFKKLPSTKLSRTLSVDYDEEIDILYPNAHFGEMAIINDCHRSVGSCAKTDCTLLTLPRAYFLQIIEKYPCVLLSLYRTNNTRLSMSNQLYIQTIDRLIREKGYTDVGNAVSKIIHDITTPISIILLQAEMIYQLYPEAYEFTKKISLNANHIDAYIREILDITREHQTSLNLASHNVPLMFDFILEIIKPLSELKSIEIHVDNTIKRDLCIDGKKIEKTILNLLKNAVEATSSRGHIYICSHQIDDYWHISIRDTGTGIPTDMLSEIFHPFITKGKTNGTGLGLAICKKCIQDHQGSISVQNHEDCGAVFLIKIPLSHL